MPKDDSGEKKFAPNRGALQSYLNSMREYKLLTASGEFRLGTAAQQGEPEARDELIKSNLRLVVKIAMEYKHTQIGLDDLIAEGNFGLIQSALRFDPSRGVRFVSYAAWWIRKYMLQAIQRQGQQSSVPSPQAAKAPGGVAHGARPKPPRTRLLSYDDFMQTSGDRHALESMALDGGGDPENVALERRLAEEIRAILDRLPTPEGTILAAHYGLDGSPPKTLQEIGDGLHLTRERVRQIELRALDRVRRLIQRGVSEHGGR